MAMLPASGLEFDPFDLDSLSIYLSCLNMEFFFSLIMYVHDYIGRGAYERQ